MRIVSTTLTGNNQDLIGDALKSVVDWVDACLVIDTGVTDRSLAVAREVAGDKYIERPFAWVNDFSAARNFALEVAHELGGDWAVTLDTDERIDRRGEDVRGVLARATVECFLVKDGGGTYMKERIFRLPAKWRFNGPTHESYPSYESCAPMPKMCFVELAKTPEQYRAKFERDVATLSRHTKENPTDPRWFYYLGDALQSLGRHLEAIRAYEECAELRGWNEESAWACYRAAECWVALGRFYKAVDACAAGLARHAGIGELAWLAAFSSYKAGSAHQAVWWARMAISMGLYRGRGADVKRIGFRHVPALYEGPYDVLRYALKDLGDASGAAEAERSYQDALRVRTGAPPVGRKRKRK
jgi:hypothetical protein